MFRQGFLRPLVGYEERLSFLPLNNEDNTMNYMKLGLMSALVSFFCGISLAAPEKRLQVRTAMVGSVKISYVIEHGRAIITSGEKDTPAIEPWTEGELAIPDKLNGHRVQELGDDAFRGCGALTAIKIPNGVQRVGARAFWECFSIVSLDFPESVMAIGKQACHGMRNLESVSIRGKVETIEDKLFEQCSSLTEINLGDSVKRVTGKSFEKCSLLKRLVFPESLKSIDNGGYSYGVCDGCGSLKEVFFLGPPPEIRNFGKDLNGCVRYSRKYQADWERWQIAKQVVGAEPFDPADIRQPAVPTAPVPTPTPKQVSTVAPPVAHSHVADAEADPFEKAETEVATTPLPSVAGKPLELDPGPVADAYRELDIHSYKCRMLLNDFALAVTNANKEAASKRVRLRRTVKDNLLRLFENATAAGNLDMALALKAALDTADGEIKGDAVAVERAREYRDKQNAAIDNALKTAGIKAAKALYSGTDLQKQETTKKGDLDTARKLAIFQQKVQNWAREANGAASKAAAR